MTPWEGIFDLVISDDASASADDPDLTNWVPCPGRCTIDHINIIRIGGGAISAKFYSRAFVGESQRVRLIYNDGEGFCIFKMPLPFGVKVGDRVVVTDSGVPAYNTDHRVTAVRNNDKEFVTDQAFTLVDNSAVALLSIPEEEWPLYKAIDDLAGTGSAADDPWVVFVNQDPQFNHANRGYPRRLYIKFADAGSYRVAIRTRDGIGAG